MRNAWSALLLALLAGPALSGCLSFLDDDPKPPAGSDPADVGYDPGTIRVTSVVKHTATVASFDGTGLAVVAYEPITGDRTPDNEKPRWGTVVFVHGWGLMKETYEGSGGATGAPIPSSEEAPYTTNRLLAFAETGLLAIAYDARGFGQSGGTASIAGPAEQADLDAILSWAEDTFSTNGNFGVVGVSYGGGHAYQAWTDNPRVKTAVPMYGWVDLYDGLAPGNVPKAEWATLLGGIGVAGSQGSVSPLLAQWYQKALTRDDLATVHAEMDQRSTDGRMAGVAKPLFVCQGMQESLFPQADRAWGQATGFTRALVFTGGHGAQDERCWSQARNWFLHFLAGFDMDVASWPALSTVDAASDRFVDYTTFPQARPRTYHPRSLNLDLDPSNTTFKVEQRLASNPLTEPSAIWDQAGLANNQVPEDFRQDPTAVFFDTAPFEGAEVVLGAPTLTLRLGEPATPPPFQVVGTLYHVDAGGSSRVLTRGAVAALTAADLDNGTVTLAFHWVKADMAPGDKLVLKLGANDSSWFLPLLANYSVTFSGQSGLSVPFFQG